MTLRRFGLFLVICTTVALFCSFARAQRVDHWEPGTVRSIAHDWIGSTHGKVCTDNDDCAVIYEHDLYDGVALADLHVGQRIQMGIGSNGNLVSIQSAR